MQLNSHTVPVRRPYEDALEQQSIPMERPLLAIKGWKTGMGCGPRLHMDPAARVERLAAVAHEGRVLPNGLEGGQRWRAAHMAPCSAFLPHLLCTVCRRLPCPQVRYLRVVCAPAQQREGPWSQHPAPGQACCTPCLPHPQLHRRKCLHARKHPCVARLVVSKRRQLAEKA